MNIFKAAATKTSNTLWTASPGREEHPWVKWSGLLGLASIAFAIFSGGPGSPGFLVMMAVSMVFTLAAVVVALASAALYPWRPT